MLIKPLSHLSDSNLIVSFICYDYIYIRKDDTKINDTNINDVLSFSIRDIGDSPNNESLVIKKYLTRNVKINIKLKISCMLIV